METCVGILFIHVSQTVVSKYFPEADFTTYCLNNMKANEVVNIVFRCAITEHTKGALLDRWMERWGMHIVYVHRVSKDRIEVQM